MAGTKFKFKVKMIGLMDMLNFKKMTDRRKTAIESAPSTSLPEIPHANQIAKSLHPARQIMTVTEVKELASEITMYTLKGEKAAYFRAGQYIPCKLFIGGSTVNRPYSIASSPKQSLEGYYQIAVKNQKDGFVSKYIIENWKVGEKVEVGDPCGTFYYERHFRDSGEVVALAGGVGITPFISMSRAFDGGDIKATTFTLIYGANTVAEICYKEELDALAAKNNNFKVVYVLANEKLKGYENGFINAKILKKYSDKDNASYFVCGPRVMYKAMEKVFSELQPKRKPRFDVLGAIPDIELHPGFPETAKGKEFSVTVTKGFDSQVIKAKSSENLITALERAGLKPVSYCRSGVCGLCHSKLISGTVFIAEDQDGRRAADLKYGYIHPCVSFPTSDLEIEIPRQKQ